MKEKHWKYFIRKYTCRSCSDFIFPDVCQMTESLILGLSALVGGLIDAKLFPDKETNNEN